MPLITLVEDEPDILEVMTYNLKREGFDVVASSSGDTGLDLIREQKPDLVLLDLMLPWKSGLEICQELKNSKATRSIPIIMITAKSEESDIVLGLGMGADDYITKPFSPRELVARVRAVLRRNTYEQEENTDGRIDLNGLMIDETKHKVTYLDQPVTLTATEFRMLHFMASHPGRVFTREQLLNQTVGENIVVVDRNVDVHIRAIRRKLGDISPDSVNVIETIRGVGYRFMEIGVT
jgi:phosphate regulon transcriptional regulator PhoB